MNWKRAGLAGCHIEDQEFPKRCGHLSGKSVVELEEMVEKSKQLSPRDATRIS